LTYIWAEKYRPTEFADVIGLPKEIPSLVGESLPHLLLTGPPGTGKTTLGRIIVNKMEAECLYLNASDERGVDTIREKVKLFTSTTSLNGKVKVVFLDEADALTKDAQNILRNLMESYHKHCRFILTGNYSNKIIEPLKSRCHWIQLRTPQKKEIVDRLWYIIRKEQPSLQSLPATTMIDGLPYNEYLEGDINKIVDRFYPDIRGCIKHLQIYSVKGELSLFEDEGKEIYKLLKDKRNFPVIRKKLIEENIDLSSMVSVLEEEIMLDEVETPKKIQLLLLLAECNKNLPTVVIQRLEFEKFVLEAGKVLG